MKGRGGGIFFLFFIEAVVTFCVTIWRVAQIASEISRFKVTNFRDKLNSYKWLFIILVSFRAI